VEDATDSTSSIEDTLTDTPLPAVSLGKDTTLCTGQSLILEAPAGTGYEYLWQDRSTAEDYTVSSAGTYWVKVTNEYGCSAADTIDVSFLVFPALSLGNDTTLCNGEALDLKISIPQAVYLWNTGSTASALSISTAGLYWVNVSEGGCEERDSINVSFKPSPTISLGDDTTLCEGQSLVLNAANNNATYLWQDGSTEPTYTVTAEGSYSVIVALDDGCDTSGKVMVDYIGKPVVNLGGDTSLCGSEKLVLDASSPQASYLWQDGSTGADLTVTQAGTYAVQVSNSCGSVVDSIAVQYGVCTCKFYVPSAFTPNGDGRNDVFRPVSKCVPAGYAFRVYDRWGMVVFNSKNSGEAWDGNVHGKLQPNGTYVWELAYVDTITGKAVKMNGTVVLVR
jgi:gliding motility-associated-like protein